MGKSESSAGMGWSRAARMRANNESHNLRTEFYSKLKEKQDILTPSQDISLDESGNIGLTNEGKHSVFADIWITAGRVGQTEYAGYYVKEDGTEVFTLYDMEFTYQEALVIENMSGNNHHNEDGIVGRFMAQNNNLEMPRALLPLWVRQSTSPTSALFQRQNNLEVLWLGGYHGRALFTNFEVYLAPRLRKQLGCVWAKLIDFGETPMLEEFHVQRFDMLKIAYSPLILSSSLAEAVTNGNDGATITVHPDIYAKLTDESNEEWGAILTSALSKNITFAKIQ